MSAVLAIDPGLTTGFLSVIDGEARPYEITGRYQAEHFFDDWMDVWGGFGRHVIIEKYKPEAGAGSTQLDALHIIGYVDGRCYKRAWRAPLSMQDRTDAKNYSTDNKLRDVGLHDITKGLGHARDAARHYLYWMMTNDHARALPERKILKNRLLAGMTARHS